jgi:hypothetical protein
MLVQCGRKAESRCALRLRHSAVYRDHPLSLNGLKTAITAYIRNISQADLQKVFANKIKRVQARIDARGYHFQRLFISAQRLSERAVQ